MDSQPCGYCGTVKLKAKGVFMKTEIKDSKLHMETHFWIFSEKDEVFAKGSVYYSLKLKVRFVNADTLPCYIEKCCFVCNKEITILDGSKKSIIPLSFNFQESTVSPVSFPLELTYGKPSVLYADNNILKAIYETFKSDKDFEVQFVATDTFGNNYKIEDIYQQIQESEDKKDID